MQFTQQNNDDVQSKGENVMKYEIGDFTERCFCFQIIYYLMLRKIHECVIEDLSFKFSFALILFLEVVLCKLGASE